MEYKITRLPIPVMSKPKIILNPSKYVVNSIPKDGIHWMVCVNTSPLATSGIYPIREINKRIGTIRTNQPTWIRGTFLNKNGTKIAAKKGMIINKFMVINL